MVLETFKPGYLESLGLGYQDLSAENEGLVHVSVTPFGQTGPYKDYAGVGPGRVCDGRLHVRHRLASHATDAPLGFPGLSHRLKPRFHSQPPGYL